MRYRTRQLGVVEVAKDKVLCLVAPLLGFEAYRKYALIPVPAAQPFFCLQSLEEPQLAFPVIAADELGMAYPIRTDDLRRVAAASADEVACWIVAALPAGGAGKLRLNLHAPVLVNVRKQLAAQIVVGDECLIVRSEIVHEVCSADFAYEARVESEAAAVSARS